MKLRDTPFPTVATYLDCVAIRQHKTTGVRRASWCLWLGEIGLAVLHVEQSSIYEGIADIPPKSATHSKVFVTPNNGKLKQPGSRRLVSKHN